MYFDGILLLTAVIRPWVLQYFWCQCIYQGTEVPAGIVYDSSNVGPVSIIEFVVRRPLLGWVWGFTIYDLIS